jgi:hypothetical protein
MRISHSLFCFCVFFSKNKEASKAPKQHTYVDFSDTVQQFTPVLPLFLLRFWRR